MSVVGSLLRVPLLGLARSRAAREAAVRLPATAAVVRRFVPGGTVEERLAAVR